MGGQAALASASHGSHLRASARARACLQTAARRRFPAQAVAAIQCPGGRRGGAGLCAGQQELKASVLTAAAPLQAARRTKSDPSREPLMAVTPPKDPAITNWNQSRFTSNSVVEKEDYRQMLSRRGDQGGAIVKCLAEGTTLVFKGYSAHWQTGLTVTPEKHTRAAHRGRWACSGEL